MMNKYKDKEVNIMIDIETLGTKTGCSILSIGATIFSTYGQELLSRPDFYTAIDRYSCIALGLVEDSSTLSWWEKQTAEARADAFSGTTIIVAALFQLSDYIKDIEGQLNGVAVIWANGANFDPVILEAAYNLASISVPWRYHNVRCYRTLKALSTVDEVSFQGVKHNALADAKHQARNAVRFLASLASSEKQNVPSLPT